MDDYRIELRVGDIIRETRNKHHDKIVGEYDEGGKHYFVTKNIDLKNDDTSVREKKELCGVENQDTPLWLGVAEVNGIKVRSAGGKPIKSGVRKLSESRTVEESRRGMQVSKDDFDRFCKVRAKSGTNIKLGVLLSGVSETTYVEILNNYKEYEEIFKK